MRYKSPQKLYQILTFIFKLKLLPKKIKPLLVLSFVSFVIPQLIYGQSLETYKEIFRPQFHFSPAQNWMNDPNGLVFYKNEYHLFFQYNPYGNKADHDSWGHAVSKDLVHWRQLPVAIPELKGVIPASGSAVVDWDNTSGFGKNGEPPLVAIYAGVYKNNINPYIAFSNNSGRTWTQYNKNPVARNSQNLRDPKVFWYPAGKKWVMVVAGDHKVLLYESKNLREWNIMSEFRSASIGGGGWECPDLFPLEVDSNPDNVKWVLDVNLTNSGGVVGDSGTQYFIGNFDGIKFSEDDSVKHDIHWVDYGKDFYAVVSYNGIPKSDGRRIWIGWMSNWLYGQDVPTYPWRGAQSIPRSLSLKTFSDGVRLIQEPIDELKKLREKLFHFENISLNMKDRIFTDKNLNGNSLEIEAEIEFESAKRFGFEVRKGINQKTVIGYDEIKHKLFIDRSKSGNTKFSDKFSGLQYGPLLASSKNINLHIFVDWSSVEVFADDGKVVMTDLIFPDSKNFGIKFFASTGGVIIKDLKVWKLKSIWH